LGSFCCFCHTRKKIYSNKYQKHKGSWVIPVDEPHIVVPFLLATQSVT
jgi:hypothetical protein